MHCCHSIDFIQGSSVTYTRHRWGRTYSRDLSLGAAGWLGLKAEAACSASYWRFLLGSHNTSAACKSQYEFHWAFRTQTKAHSAHSAMPGHGPVIARSRRRYSGKPGISHQSDEAHSDRALTGCHGTHASIHRYMYSLHTVGHTAAYKAAKLQMRSHSFYTNCAL